MFYFIFAYFLFYGYLAFKKFDWAFFIVIATLPSYLIRFNVFGLPTTALEAMIWILLVIWAIKNSSRFLEEFKKITRCNWKNYKMELIFTAVLIISLISVFVGEVNREALGIWKAYFLDPIILGLLFLNFKKEKRINVLIWGSGFLAIWIGCLAVIQKMTWWHVPGEWAGERVTSVFSYPNAIGLLLAPLIMIFLIKIINGKSENKKITIFFLNAIILSILAIIFAKSEGALLGLAFGLTVFFLLWNKISKKFILSLFVVIFIGVIVFPSLKQTIYNEMTLKSLSGQIRLKLWGETWDMLKDGRLTLGAGLAKYQVAVRPYHVDGIFFNKENDPDFARKIVIFDAKYKAEHWQPVEIYLYPHNIFLNFWSELGLFGLIFFVLIMGYFLYERILNIFLDNDRLVELSFFCAMIVLFVHGIFDVPYFKNDLACLFWLIFVAPYANLKE